MFRQIVFRPASRVESLNDMGSSLDSLVGDFDERFAISGEKLLTRIYEDFARFL